MEFLKPQKQILKLHLHGRLKQSDFAIKFRQILHIFQNFLCSNIYFFLQKTS